MITESEITKGHRITNIVIIKRNQISREKRKIRTIGNNLF